MKTPKDRSKTAMVVALTLIMTFMEMTALPAALLCDVTIADIDPIYFALMLNFLMAVGCVKSFLSKTGSLVYS